MKFIKKIILLIIIIYLTNYNKLLFSAEKKIITKKNTITFLILIKEKIDNKIFNPGYTKSEIILQNAIQKIEFDFINPLMVKNINKDKKQIIKNPQKWLKKTQIKNKLRKLKIDYLITGKITSSQQNITVFSKKLILYRTQANLNSYLINNGELISHASYTCNDTALNKESASQKSITKAIKNIIFINGKSKKYNNFLQDIINNTKK